MKCEANQTASFGGDPRTREVGARPIIMRVDDFPVRIESGNFSLGSRRQLLFSRILVNSSLEPLASLRIIRSP